MAQVNFRIEENIKKSAEQACAEMGLTMTAAINIFLTKVAREKRVPFELSADPFYSKRNMEYLESVVKDINNGHAKLIEHDLLEDED